MIWTNITWYMWAAAILSLSIAFGIIGIVVYDLLALAASTPTVSDRLRSWADTAPWVPVVSSSVIWILLTTSAIALIVHLWGSK